MTPFPNIQKGDYVVIMADGATGNILIEPGLISFGDSDSIYKIFSSIEQASSFIQSQQQEDDTLEFILKNHANELVKHFPALRWNK